MPRKLRCWHGLIGVGVGLDDTSMYAVDGRSATTARYIRRRASLLPLQARFVPTLVLERLRAVGEAAAVPKKSISGGVDTTVAADDAAEGINSPKVGALPLVRYCCKAGFADVASPTQQANTQRERSVFLKKYRIPAPYFRCVRRESPTARRMHTKGWPPCVPGFYGGSSWNKDGRLHISMASVVLGSWGSNARQA